MKSLESSNKELPSVRDFISKEKLTPKIINEIEKIEGKEKKGDRSKMFYKGHTKTYDFRKFETIYAVGNEIRNNFTNMYKADNEQNDLAEYVREFKTKIKPQSNSN